ncbi:hypothetical protein AKJ16_DCAP04524 [Drosera capensis]
MNTNLISDQTTTTRSRIKKQPIDSQSSTQKPATRRQSQMITRPITALDYRFLSIILFIILSVLLSISTIRLSPPKPPPPVNRTELARSRIAVCLVGGARRFELTGPSIVEKLLKEYPNADVFLNSPFDENSYKLLVLKSAPQVVAVRVFEQRWLEETRESERVLSSEGSPNGIQGLLQYFNLVEGCISLIQHHETRFNFTYDWIIRTRVDGFWPGPLNPNSFIRGHYVVPPGSAYGGLNDRLGIGEHDISMVALARHSLVPTLDSAGFSQLNSESAFKAQLTLHNIPHITMPQPFCILSDRVYVFPPVRFDVPVLSLTSRGEMSGAKCRPCRPACVGPCVGRVMNGLEKGWSWAEEWNGSNVDLCDARGEWEVGWEGVFDRVVGPELAESRRRAGRLSVEECARDWEEMREKTSFWESPSIGEICKLGLRKIK